MSTNLRHSLLIVFRYMCKNFQHKNNLLTFKNLLKSEFQNFENKKFSNDLEKIIKISEWNELLRNMNKMDFHIDKENELLASYNINIVRDQKSQIEDIANRVGLKL